MMDPKEKQKLMLLFVIFGIAGLLIYFNLLLKPQFSRFIVMNREYQTVKSRVRSANALIANKVWINKQYADLLDLASSSEKRLTPQGQISGLLGDLSAMAESSGVKILRVAPIDKTDDILQAGDFYTEFPVLIEAKGGYHQFGIFINKLEAADRFIRVDDMDIKARTDDPRRHDIRLQVTTYITR